MKIPHAWNGSEWTCLGCGEVYTDPCGCRCCGLQCCTSQPETAQILRGVCDSLRERYGDLRDHAYLEQAQVRRVRRPASAGADQSPHPTG